MARRTHILNVIAIALILAGGGCGLMPAVSPTLADQVAAGGHGYVFEPLGAAAPGPGALTPREVAETIAEYGRGRFFLRRMEFGEVRPNVSGPSRLAYVAEVVDTLRPEVGGQLMFLDAETGEIFLAPSVP